MFSILLYAGALLLVLVIINLVLVRTIQAERRQNRAPRDRERRR